MLVDIHTCRIFLFYKKDKVWKTNKMLSCGRCSRRSVVAASGLMMYGANRRKNDAYNVRRIRHIRIRYYFCCEGCLIEIIEKNKLFLGMRVLFSFRFFIGMRMHINHPVYDVRVREERNSAYVTRKQNQKKPFYRILDCFLHRDCKDTFFMPKDLLFFDFFGKTPLFAPIF